MRRYTKFLLALALASSFVACGSSEQTAQQQPSLKSLDVYVQANQAKLQDDRAKSQFKMALDNLELLKAAQNAQDTQGEGAQNRAAGAAIGGATAAAIVAFEAKTIPDRIKLGLKVLEAIVQGSTELKNKKQPYIDLFAMRVTVSLLDMVNPLSDTKATYKNLNKALQEVMKAPEQSGDDLANLHIRQDLDNRLHQYRFYKFNQTAKSSAEVNKKLDLIVLKATGVRLDPLATVDGVKNVISQVNIAAARAIANQMPDDFVRPASKPFSFDLINQEQIKAGIDMAKEMAELLKEMIESFVSMAKNGVSFVSGGLGKGKIDFDFGSIPARAAVLAQVAKAIALGTGELSNKIQAAHTRLGFASTQALISAANPLSKTQDVEQALEEIKSAIDFAQNARNLQPNDTSSINHKESLAKKLREYRTYQFNKFVFKPQAEIDGFNRLLLKATGIRLDPTQTVQQVEDLKKSLAKEVARITAVADIKQDKATANFWHKDNLRTVIDKGFFTNKSKLSKERKKAFDEAVWNARGVYLDIKASTQKVYETRQVILDFIQEAK